MADSTELRQGSRIYIEALTSEQLQRLGRPELPIRLTISGIVADPAGERPPPVLELRFDRAMLAGIEQQIQGLRLPSEPDPADGVHPPEPLVRRTPGEWLHEKLKPDEIAERHGTWTGLGASAEKMELFRDALRRAEAMT
ncbi:hypothetical protein [Kitasatospora purpeofusca]|uniref:Uncharacterized protein n=1 Tax=Kitasatospora purpeofusca TaxID=67352 RepID=A0ABZ1TUF0_9ACTN|nr:hypothetical protein [Kitasatospora purpeofusca]